MITCDNRRLIGAFMGGSIFFMNMPLGDSRGTTCFSSDASAIDLKLINSNFGLLQAEKWVELFPRGKVQGSKEKYGNRLRLALKVCNLCNALGSAVERIA